MSRILLRFDAERQRAELARMNAQVLREHPPRLEPVSGSVYFGDPRELRGIPVTGAGAGLDVRRDPLLEVMRRERERTAGRARHERPA